MNISLLLTSFLDFEHWVGYIHMSNSHLSVRNYNINHHTLNPYNLIHYISYLL